MRRAAFHIALALLGADSIPAAESAPGPPADPAVWQWSVPVPPLADRPNETPRAYLWVPPDRRNLRGLVFGHHNMEEIGVFEHPAFRNTLAELAFAEIWVAPTFDPYFRFDQGAGEKFDALLKALAEASGYDELTDLPVVPCGHSAAASLPWYFAAWKPERTLAGLSFSGQWPYWPDEKNAPHVAGKSIDSVPGLVTIGEYEWADENIPKGLQTKAAHPTMPLSAVGCPADGHFLALDDKIEFLALYLRKAVQCRLGGPAGGRPWSLKPIDVTRGGWLVDRYRTNDPMVPAAPVGQFRGDPAQAFWFFDEELATAAETFQKKHRGKPALLGFEQDGRIVPQKPGTHPQVWLPFHPGSDGVTFTLQGAFLDVVPEGRPARWAGRAAGEAIERPSGGPPIVIQRICGPIRRTQAGTWELSFDRASYLGDRRGNEAWLGAVWPGDATHKRAVQQAVLQIPGSQKSGAPQHINFEAPATLPAGTKTIKLKASADSGLPVRFYVREGPAVVDGDILRLTPIPPRAKYPVAVTVVAWQFGRAAEPAVQSAEPVARTIHLVR